MFKAEHLTDALLKRFAMEIPKGQFLFKQGEKGNTMFILVEGQVDFFHKVLQNERKIGTLAEGEIFGERAIISPAPYKRQFSALARTDATVLQFDHQSLKLIQTKMPDFATKLLGLVIQRLERANQMVSILQLTDPVERTVMYLLYAAEHFSKKNASGGSELTFNLEETKGRINVDVDTLGAVAEELAAAKIAQRNGDTLVLLNEAALMQYVPSLKERIAA